MQVSLGAGPIADDSHGDAILHAFDLEAHRVAGRLPELHSNRRLHGQNADVLDAEVVHHLAAAAHLIGVFGELLTEDLERKVCVPVQVAPHGTERAGTVVRHHPEVSDIIDDF